MTQAAFNPASEAIFEDLLKRYIEALDANVAFNELFGATDNDMGEYEEYLTSIAQATKDSDTPINTKAEAKALIVSSKFKDNQILFKKLGIATLVDPEILQENRLVLPAWQTFKDMIPLIGDRAQIDLFYDPSAGDSKTGLQTISQGAGFAISVGSYPYAGFVSEPMIVLLINLGLLRSKSNPESAAAYWDLAEHALDIISAGVTHLKSVYNDPELEMPPYFGKISKKAAVSHSKILGAIAILNQKRLSADPSEPPVKDLWNNETEGLAWLASTMEALLPEWWVKDIYYTLAPQTAFGFGAGLAKPDEVASVKAVLNTVQVGGLDSLVETLALSHFGPQFFSPANEAQRVAARKENFIKFLKGQKVSDGDASGQSGGSSSVALKDKKVKEAVLKADRNIKPFDLQCHLMQNIVKLAHQRQGDPKFQPRYRHINPVTTGGRPAEVLNTIQHGDQTEAIKEFINICPDVYGLLEPYIQIWRQEFNDDGTIKLDPETQLPVEKQLHIENFLNPDDLITLPTGRTPGAGIKSFSWSLKGVQPAEVDNNISATLVMYFQTINDFFNGASQAGKGEPNFLDLIINSPAVRKLREGKSAAADNKDKLKKCNFVQDNLHKQYKGTNYRIRVNAGWSVPPSLMPSVEISSPMRRAIEQTQVSLYLQQVRHNLDFKQNGSLELSIEYVASIAGLLTSKSADIFAPTSSPEIEARLDALDERLENIKTKEQSKPNSISDSDRKLKRDLLEQKRQARQEDKLIKYRKLLCGLFQEQNSRIYNLTINALDLLRPPMRDLDAHQRAARAKRFKKEPVAVYLASDVNFSLLSSVNATLTGNGLTQEEGENPSGTAQAARVFSETEQTRFEDIKKDPGTFRFIPFFYLGDLIDSVLQQIENNNGGSQLSFKMFLSETEMIDPNIALQIGDLEEVIRCGEASNLDWLVRLVESDPARYADIANISTIMNIGDIPISLDAFQVWFKDNVIKKDRESYYFLHFIKDICADLITKAMGSQCFGSNINFSQRFDAQPLHLAKSSLIETGKVVDSTELGRLHKKVLPTFPSNKSIGGFILVSTDSKPSNLTGNYDSDMGRGIYHHFIGASCGLLKTMVFNREDQEFLREMKIQKFGALGAEQLRELYSARLELVGNNLYKNGMYIYINPTLIGASVKELDFLGLHGYYLVTGVESKITPSGFTTSLTALHEGIRFDKSRLPSISVLSGVAEPAPPNVSPNAGKPSEDDLVITRLIGGTAAAALAKKRAASMDEFYAELAAEKAAAD